MMVRNRPLDVVLISIAMIGICGAGEPPRLISSWKEKHIDALIFSPDGRSVVSSGREGHRLRDVNTGKVRAVLNESPRAVVTRKAFTPDSRLLFVQGSSPRSLPLIVHDLTAWDVETGKIRGEFPYVGEHLDEGAFEVSRDGRWLAVVENSQRLPAEVKTSEIQFDGRFTAKISMNINPGLPRVKIWDIANWKEVATVDGGLPLAFSPDGATLATGDRDWKTPVAKLWETKSGRPRSVLKDRSPGVWPLVFSPDGGSLVSGEHDEKSLWTLGDGRRWALKCEGSGGSRGPAFSGDGGLLFPNGLPYKNPQIGQKQEYFCFDVAKLPPSRLDLGPGELIISPGGRRFAAVLGEDGTGDARTVILKELPSLRESGRFDVEGLMGADYSPEGRWLALLVARYEDGVAGKPSRSIWEMRLVDPATGRDLVTIPSLGDNWGNYNWKFSSSGKLLALFYCTGSNSYRDGEEEPNDRPLNVEIRELPPQ